MEYKVVFVYRVSGYYSSLAVTISGKDSKEFYKNLKQKKKELSKQYKIVDYMVFNH